MLFWIPNSFCTFMIMVGEELPSLPPLKDRHWFFIILIFEQLSCPEKQSCPESFHCVEIFFIFQDFEQLALALKNRVFPEIFRCIKYSFYIKDFWAACACLKNRVCPEFTVFNIYFLSFRILNNLRLPWKTEFALKFFTVLKYFLSFRIFEQLELALKTEFALNFSSRGGGRPFAPPPPTPLALFFTCNSCYSCFLTLKDSNAMKRIAQKHICPKIWEPKPKYFKKNIKFVCQIWHVIGRERGFALRFLEKCRVWHVQSTVLMEKYRNKENTALVLWNETIFPNCKSDLFWIWHVSFRFTYLFIFFQNVRGCYRGKTTSHVL